MKKIALSFLVVFMLMSCQNEKDEVLKSFEVYCEMVQYGAKPIALSNPMLPEEADAFQSEFKIITDSAGLFLYREDDFPVTELFPAEATDGKSIFVIYKDEHRFTQYDQLRKDIIADFDPPQLLARRMGRILGYDIKGINELLMQNSDYRSFASFGIQQQVTHLYYENVEGAKEFYANKIGLERINDNQFFIGESALIQINPVSEDYPAGLPKSTAIALLTDQLASWYEHVQSEGIKIKYTYKPKERGPHDGFVAIDPEGYLLEFEQFKQHPENELFMATLDKTPRVETAHEGLYFYASITWTYHQDLLAQQNYYDEIMGFQMVADQGWTKIYQASSSGYIGLVDERRGMEDYADRKAVKIEWRVDDDSGLVNYAMNSPAQGFYGPEKYEYQIR